MKIKKGFTLMEILIVIALIAIIATVAIVLFNPWAQIGKGYDAKRKHDLADLQKVLEDWYNDKGCYPKPREICYDVPPPPTNVCKSGVGIQPVESQTCHICGNESNSPLFSPYLSQLPCDPQHKQKQYLYEVAAAPGFLCSTIADTTSPCPQWYRVYSSLSNQSDPSAKELGCQGGGCGIAPIFGNDYGVTSPNEKLKKTLSYYCYTTSKTCDNESGKLYETLQADSSCTTIYSSQYNCCNFLPKRGSCP